MTKRIPGHTWPEELSALVESCDLAGLIAFSQRVPGADTAAWRTEVLESGFMALYEYLSYDQWCGKLGAGGLDLLDEVVAAAEVFQGLPLRELRAQVLAHRSEELEATDADQAKLLALRAVAELSLEAPASQAALVLRARLYHKLAQLDADQALPYWQLAIADLTTAGASNLWILYHPWPPAIEGMPEAQQQARAAFNRRLNQELLTQPDRLWPLLEEGVRMQEYRPSEALATQLSAWLQTALRWPSAEAPPQLLRSAGLLLHQQGQTHQRADYLAKAIECFEQFIRKEPAHAMEVYYLASVWEDWAALREAQGGSGAEYLAKAWDVYRQHEAVVRLNFSPLLHYAEFLERLHSQDKLTERPSAEQVLALAVEAEAMGNGYYSGPGLIQVRLALRQQEPETAIYQLCRLLLRHELCIDREIEKLRHTLADGTAPAIVRFLDQTLLFMQDIAPGYYYNPALSVDDLNKLNPTETIAAWQQRMTELRTRRQREE